MSTTQEASSMAISEQVEQMERDDLEDFAVSLYEDLEERVQALEEENKDTDDDLIEVRGVNSPSDAAMSDVWVAGEPLGTIVHNSKQRSIQNQSRIDDLERGEVSVSDVVDAGASDSELQIQRWRADVQDSDSPDDVSGLTKNQARSTVLWADFWDHAERSHGKLKLDRADASKIFRISEHDLPTDRNTVNRCMRFMARGTGTTDDPESEDHLVTFVPGDQGSRSVLVADQDEFEQFVADAAGIETPNREHDEDLYATPDQREDGESDASADDATDSVDEELAAITAGTAVTAGSQDAVADDHGMENDAPSAREL